MPKQDIRSVQVMVALQEAIRQFAQQGDCMIVGCCADIILDELNPDVKWEQREPYYLCVNISGKQIKQFVPALAAYVNF